MNTYQWEPWTQTFWKYHFPALTLNEEEDFKTILGLLQNNTHDVGRIRQDFFSDPSCQIEQLLTHLATITEAQKIHELWILISSRILEPALEKGYITQDNLMSLLKNMPHINTEDKYALVVHIWQNLAHHMTQSPSGEIRVPREIDDFIHMVASDIFPRELRPFLLNDVNMYVFQEMLLAPLKIKHKTTSLFEELFLPKLTEYVENPDYLQHLSPKFMNALCQSPALTSMLSSHNFSKEPTRIKNFVLQLLPMFPSQENLSVLYQLFLKNIENEVEEVSTMEQMAFNSEQHELLSKAILSKIETILCQRDATQKQCDVSFLTESCILPLLLKLIQLNPSNDILEKAYHLIFIRRSMFFDYYHPGKKGYMQIQHIFDASLNDTQKNCMIMTLVEHGYPLDSCLNQNQFTYYVQTFKHTEHCIKHMCQFAKINNEQKYTAIQYLDSIYSSLTNSHEKKKFISLIDIELLHELWLNKRMSLSEYALNQFNFTKTDEITSKLFKKCLSTLYSKNVAASEPMREILAKKILPTNRYSDVLEHYINDIKKYPEFADLLWKTKSRFSYKFFLKLLPSLSPIYQDEFIHLALAELLENKMIKPPQSPEQHIIYFDALESERYTKILNDIGPYLTGNYYKLRAWNLFLLNHPSKLNVTHQLTPKDNKGKMLNYKPIYISIKSEKVVLETDPQSKKTEYLNDRSLSMLPQEYFVDYPDTIEENIKKNKNLLEWPKRAQDDFVKSITKSHSYDEQANLFLLIKELAEHRYLEFTSSILNMIQRYLMNTVILSEEDRKKTDHQIFFPRDNEYYDNTLQKSPLARIWLPYSLWHDHSPECPEVILDYTDLLSADGLSWAHPMDFDKISDIILQLFDKKYAVTLIIKPLLEKYPEFKKIFFVHLNKISNLKYLELLNESLVSEYILQEKSASFSLTLPYLLKHPETIETLLDTPMEHSLKIEIYQQLWKMIDTQHPHLVPMLSGYLDKDPVLKEVMLENETLKEAWLFHHYSFGPQIVEEWEHVQSYIQVNPNSPVSRKFAEHAMDLVLSAKKTTDPIENQHQAIKILDFLKTTPELLHAMSITNQNKFFQYMQLLTQESQSSPVQFYLESITISTEPRKSIFIKVLLDTLFAEALHTKTHSFAQLTKCLQELDPHIDYHVKQNILMRMSQLIDKNKRSHPEVKTCIQNILSDIELTWIFACYAFDLSEDESNFLNKLYSKKLGSNQSSFREYIKFIATSCESFIGNTYINSLYKKESSFAFFSNHSSGKTPPQAIPITEKPCLDIRHPGRIKDVKSPSAPPASFHNLPEAYAEVMVLVDDNNQPTALPLAELVAELVNEDSLPTAPPLAELVEEDDQPTAPPLAELVEDEPSALYDQRRKY
jgi:hypothetical protein